MHYNISYKDMDTEAADKKAWKDIQDYLGVQTWTEKFAILRAWFMHRSAKVQMITCDGLRPIPAEARLGSPIESLRFMCSFMGIQGYPVETIARRLGVFEDQCPQCQRYWPGERHVEGGLDRSVGRVCLRCQGVPAIEEEVNA